MVAREKQFGSLAVNAVSTGRPTPLLNMTMETPLV